MNIIKKTLILLTLLFSPVIKSQPVLTSQYDTVLIKVKTTLNAKDYNAFYKLLSSNSQSKLTEKAITSFLKKNICEPYGNLNTLRFIKIRNSFMCYKSEFDNGNLELQISFNDFGLIDGFTFKPFKEEITIKQMYLSNNKKITKLDLDVDKIVEEFMSNPIHSALSIGIIQNNETTFYHYGEVKKGTQQLPNNNTLYEIGSITKTFTGLLLAQAINDGKLKLDDDIRKYLPKNCSNLCFGKTPITLKHLVTHTSRIPSVPNNIESQPNFNELDPYRYYDKKMIFAHLSTLQLDTIAGIKLEYSNLGMALIGIILETVYEKNYETLIKKHITNSFKMNSTCITVTQTNSVNLPIGYNEKGIETPYWNLNDFAAVGGIKSTIEDMTLYINENFNTNNDKKISLSHQQQFKNDNTAIALAWFFYSLKDNEIKLWHNGGTYGFSSFCIFNKTKKCGLIVLCNSGTGVDDVGINLFEHL